MDETNLQTGLDDSAVKQRFDAGQHNLPLAPLTRSIGQIIQQNTLTLFNFVNLALGALIITTGSYKNLLFLGVAVVNTAIGTFQEIRAKRRIDHLSLIAAAKTTVLRNGQETTIDQEDIVLGDIILLKRGDQIPVDGEVRATNGVEVDESPLTGESRAITKQVGDQLLSGSFILAGQVTMQATAVGENTFTSKLALEAKAERTNSSQLLATINRIIRVLTYVLIPLGIALFTVSMIRRGVYNRAILTTSAAMIGMIPEGLVLLTNVALAVSARNLAARRVLVRALPAIEALARVDIIALDKTGTITSGKLKVSRALPADGVTEAELTQAAATVIYGLNDDNETALALKGAYTQPHQQAPIATMPFSSARKWSGVTIADNQSYVVGAPEFIFQQPLPDAIQTEIKQAAETGIRVIAVARVSGPLQQPLTDPTFMGLIFITDEIRPNAIDTFSFFERQGVQLKVISGDNPVTVANIAKQAHLTGADAYFDMSTVTDATDFHDLVKQYNVFGRVTPDQKKSLISAYQDLDHTVAMTGDGVNDVLALRQSDCGIAMASGAEAASSIADFVLLDSNFDAMTGVLNEGRRVINNIERVSAMYLVKTMYSVLLAIIFLFMASDFPIIPINLTPVSAIAVAVPSFFLTLEPNFRRVTGQFMQKVMTVAAPAAIAVVIYTMILTWLQSWLHMPFETTSTLTVLLIAAVSFNVLLFVSQPFNRNKIFMLSLVLIALFIVFFVINGLFSLVSLWSWYLMIFYVPLLISTLPVYFLLQEFLGKRVLARINWR